MSYKLIGQVENFYNVEPDKILEGRGKNIHLEIDKV